MKSTRENTMKIPFIVVLTSVVLSFCILIGTVSAWLIKHYTYESTDNQFGAVEVELYANGNKVLGRYEEVEGVSHWVCSTPYEITGSTVERTNINLTMRNNGTINALVRTTISIFYYDENNNKVLFLLTNSTPTASNQCKLETTDWVYDFGDNNKVSGGYMFYNKQLKPYTIKEISNSTPGGTITENTYPANIIKFVDGILLHSSMANTTIYIDVTIDAIAYSGNIYKKIKEYDDAGKDFLDEIDQNKYGALPYGTIDTLPSDWTAWQ